jgi:LysM repeat protein
MAMLAGATALGDTYVVKSGDSLDRIARRHGTTVSALVQANGMKNPDQISVGQKLILPPGKAGAPSGGGSTSYKVEPGDTLGSIASDHGVSVSALVKANKLDDPDRLTPGQTLQIPTGASPSSAPGVRHPLPPDVRRALDGIRVTPGKWRYIVIHHSATKNGSAKSMDLYHRQRRHMENGLAYHFVIGNGRGMRDGEIAIGNRWKRQIKGGHLASTALNEKSIGICLVGNFDTSPPTSQQMRNLYALVEYLEGRARIAPSSVKLHREINTKPTRCPGRHFPSQALRQHVS